MDRRDFLRAGAAGAMVAGIGASGVSAGQGEAAEPLNQADQRLAPPCGLFCGACDDRQKGVCHGCGCSCGCAGKWHAEHCAIAQCATVRKIASCADCRDFACTELIQFTSDPIWRTHSVCIENLRRRKAIGTTKWIAEQEQYWSDPDHLAAWNALSTECAAKAKSRKNER